MVDNLLSRFEPFGSYLTKPPSTVNPGISDRGFTGHRQNNTGGYNFGLIYMNARYYLPEIGRFISADTIVPDPANPQSFNRYGYTLNNPVNFTDPTGHLTDEEIWEFFGFADQAAAEAAGWSRKLIELLWYDDFTWGMVFGYNKVGETYTAYAMLALFENNDDPSAITLEGGFYGVVGAEAGNKVDPASILDPYAPAARTDDIQAMFQNNWDEMPVSYDNDYTGIPALVPGIYTQVFTEELWEAVDSLFIGGGGVIACFVAQPCGSLIAAAGAASSIYGAYTTLRDISSPVNVFARYPLIQRPRDSIIPGPVQYFDFGPRGKNR